MYLPALPSLAHDLHGQPSEVQLTLTSFVVGLALGQLVAGPVSDTLGRRRPLLLGLAGYVIASTLCAFATTTRELIALRLAQGLGGAAAIVIARAIVRDLYTGADAAHFFSLLMLVNGLAPILAPLIGGQLMRYTSWRGVFVVLAAIGTVLLAATFLGLRETLPQDLRRTGGAPETVRTFGRLVRDRAFVGYALTVGFGYAGLFAYIGASPFVIQVIYGLSPQAFSLLFGVNALGIMATAQTGARLVHRVGAERLLTTGLAIMGLGAIGLVASAVLHLGLAGILPSFFAVASSIGLILPNGVALALTNQARVAGSASALIGMTQYLIGGATAPLVGIAGSGSAVPVTVVIATTAAAAAASLFLLARVNRRLVSA